MLPLRSESAQMETICEHTSLLSFAGNIVDEFQMYAHSDSQAPSF